MRRARLLVAVLPALLLLPAGCTLAPRQQTTDTVVMIRPDSFRYNPQTAQTNTFMHAPDDPSRVPELAMSEFDGMVGRLRGAGVEVIPLPSRHDVATPDAVFPNNWFSLHREDGGGHLLVLYPMQSPNRRLEERPVPLEEALASEGVQVDRVVNLAGLTRQGLALEGTGSLVLDRVARVAFASLSPRTSPEALAEFCRQVGYRAVTFESRDASGDLIYHTNVMMSVGDRFAVICAESITDPLERRRVTGELRRLGKEIVEITRDQTLRMCGNILQLHNRKGEKLIVMSATAHAAFTPEQKAALGRYGRLVPVDVGTIEFVAGGSARCMIAEVF